jgi:hypothetical protein
VPAGAQLSSEHITSYDVDITIASNGELTTVERITYDFGSNERHGIFRDLVRKEKNFDPGHDRRYDLDVREVTMDGSPATHKDSNTGLYRRIKIGNPDQTVTGQHTYEITYTTGGALLPFPDHDELYWDAIGNQWPVPIDHASVVVHAPADITDVTCFKGPDRSQLPCTETTHSGTTATFASSGLGSSWGTTIVVALPKGAITPEPAPLLVKHHTLADAFSVNPKTVGIGAGGSAIGLAGVFMLARRGRDRQYTGSAVDAAMGNTSGDDELAPLLRREVGPVEFVPPDGILPGEVGTLVDERVDLRDVTATIIHLATRGWLTIEELEPTGLFHRKSDYQLHRNDTGKGELIQYEKQLLDGLFETGPSVTLSDLKYKFRPTLTKVQDGLYVHAVRKGWYGNRPDRTRAKWRALGHVVFWAGVALTVWIAIKTSFGIAPLALVVTGAALVFFAKRMPARTARGSAMTSRVRGFRRLFDEGEEDVRARFAEQHGIFSEYLPYAIVFGCAEKWAHAFEGLDAEALGTSGWYTGYGNHPLGALYIASSMNHFDSVATGTMYASMPSSSGSSGFSGGFSGGGGGGGGGGSW